MACELYLNLAIENKLKTATVYLQKELRSVQL
jgi:hypothetical protein